MTHSRSPRQRAQLIEGDGVVFIEGGSRIRGWVSEDFRCGACGNAQLYDMDHDAYFCATCNEWLESACGDAACRYCPDRPPHPLPRSAGRSSDAGEAAR